IELFVRLHRRSGRDAHKKAVAALARRFFGEPPAPYAVALGGPAAGAGSAVPGAAAAGDGQEPGAQSADFPPRTDGLCLDAALRQGSAAALLFESGYRPQGLEEYLSRLLPWVCVNARPLPENLSMIGAVVGGIGERRLLFRGWELAYTALRLATCLARPKEWRVLDALVPQLLGFTLQKPIGTAWVSTDPEAKVPVGPVDSRVLVREVQAMLGLRRQFPAALEASMQPE
ncbi:MAG: hypothetical protein JW820_14230, partial [Spirochaetales bacterium]|nr:hypothetical protein [Spirochaetales bacterium]